MCSKIVGTIMAIAASFMLPCAVNGDSMPPTSASANGRLVTPPTQVSVSMYELNNAGAKVVPLVQCTNGSGNRSTKWGCTAYCTTGDFQQHCTNPLIHPPPVPAPLGQPGHVYPFSTNQVTVNIDGSAAYNGYTYNRYLRDVVAQEPNPEAFHAKAVLAQAIAARTYAYYQVSAANETVIDNSASYQVYVPFRYDSRKRYYGDYRPPIEAAMQDRIYLVPYPNPPPYVFAEYFADRPGSTLSGATPNLIAVADPISQTGCGSSVSGHGHGLSQQGASRWARGDGYFNINSSASCPWSVSWQNTRQILAHYYTNTVFYDASGNAISPTFWRWNALEIRNLPPAVVQPGAVYTLDVQVQNTGAWSWTSQDDIRLSYQVCQGTSCTNTSGLYNVAMPQNLPPGNAAWFNGLSVPIPANWRGPAAIRLDVRRGPDWLAAGGWYTQDILICVSSCNPRFLPTMRRGGIFPDSSS